MSNHEPLFNILLAHPVDWQPKGAGPAHTTQYVQALDALLAQFVHYFRALTQSNQEALTFKQEHWTVGVTAAGGVTITNEKAREGLNRRVVPATIMLGEATTPSNPVLVDFAKNFIGLKPVHPWYGLRRDRRGEPMNAGPWFFQFGFVPLGDHTVAPEHR
jgi:hypothetical protein